MAKKTAAEPDSSDNNLTDINFESTLAELEGLVDQMESGELSLNDSLQAFERGIKLTRQCQTALEAAELRVKVLTDEGDLVDFDTDEQD